jgi:hypothetical protein
VIIPALQIPLYLETLVFPLEIFEERGDRIAAIVDKLELLVMIQREQIIGIGSWKHIKRLRLCKREYGTQPASVAYKPKSMFPIAEDCRTTYLDGTTYFPHMAHCLAYEPGLRRGNAS